MLEKDKTEIVNDSYSRALSFYSKGKLDNAQKCCNRILAASNADYRVYNLLGLLAQTRDSLGEAFSYFKKALELNPKCPITSNNLGTIYNKKELEET